MNRNEMYQIFRFVMEPKIAGQIVAAIEDRGWYRPYSVARILAAYGTDEFETEVLPDIRRTNQANRDLMPYKRRRVRKSGGKTILLTKRDYPGLFR